MVFNNEDLRVFRQLGMTMQQTKVYLTLSKLEQATVRTIARTAQMARAEVYRIIPKLQEIGLVKKLITTPTSFRAVPISIGISILLENEAENHRKNQEKAEQFLQNFKSKIKKTSQFDKHYSLTAGLKAEVPEFLRNLRELQTSTDGIFPWRDILYIFSTYFEDYKRILERGIQLRRITSKPEGEKIPKFIEELKEAGSFEMRNTFPISNAQIDIFDNKRVNIITIPNSGRNEMEVLRTENPAVVGLVKEYFELKWNSSIKLI